MKKMIKNYVKALMCLSLLTFAACKNPTDDIKVVVDTNIIKYSALINITDVASGSPAQNVTITVTGDNANDVYDISGKKALVVKDGMIDIGLNPNVTPTADKPITVTLVINASGYKQITQSVTFKAGTMQQVISVSLSKTAAATVTQPITPPKATATNVSLDFQGYCPNRTNLVIRPSLYVFFKEHGSTAAYQYLGYMTDGHIETNLLTLGKTYDFQITYGGENYVVTQLIDQTSYSESFSMGAQLCSSF